MQTLMHRSMSIARFIENGIGSHAKNHLPELLEGQLWRSLRSLWLQVAGKKPVEGHPDEAGQAGPERGTQGGTATVGLKGGRSSLHPLWDMT